MIFYITKYALTQGIIELDADSLSGYQIDNGRLWALSKDQIGFSYVPGEWHTNKGMAINNAEQRRRKKIASLKDEISRLEQLSFAENEEQDADL